VAVTVNPVNLAAPTVSVPTVTGTLKTGTWQTITTNAFAVAPNTIVSVQFLVNGAPLATVLSAPYTTSWTPLVPGTYSITAIATDSAANATTSAPALGHDHSEHRHPADGQYHEPRARRQPSR